MTSDERVRFRALIGATIGVPADRVTLFAKGRVALYAILRALDVGPGDEVILPAFTCVAVPNAILYTGARPVWADIDPLTFCIDPAAVQAAIGPRTRVILAQNTFGLSADLDAIMSIAEPAGITVVDDCTHGLGGTYHGRPNGATAPLSFFSTQWSKPISTGLGGFAVDREGTVAARLRETEQAAAEPSVVRAAILEGLAIGREHAGRGRVFRGGRGAYRALGRLGVVPGSSDSGELSGTTMPHDFLARLSESQARRGVRRLGDLAAETERRRAIGHQYSEWLRANGRTAAAEPDDTEHAFLRYPLRVAERQRFTAAAERAGIDLGDWFVSPVHPTRERLERWGYVAGSAPNAEEASREIVNLPTDPTQREGDLDRVISMLAQQVDVIV